MVTEDDTIKANAGSEVYSENTFKYQGSKIQFTEIQFTFGIQRMYIRRRISLIIEVGFIRKTKF